MIKFYCNLNYFANILARYDNIDLLCVAKFF